MRAALVFLAAGAAARPLATQEPTLARCVACNAGGPCAACKACVNEARDAACADCPGGTCLWCWEPHKELPNDGKPCLGAARNLCCNCWNLQAPFTCRGPAPPAVPTPPPAPAPPSPPTPPAPTPPAPTPPAPPTPPSPSSGTYSVASGSIANVPGLSQGGTPSATIFYPTSGKSGERFPFISFGHGVGAGGPSNPIIAVYKTLLTMIASHGFVVVAPDTCPTTPCANRFAKDQVATIKACRENPNLHPALATADFSRVGVAGHSQGGMSTIAAAGGGSPPVDPTMYNISAAVSQHSCGPPPAGGIKIPIMFTAGSSDPICPDSVAKKAFGELGSDVPRILLDIKGNGHFDPTDDKREPASARANSEDPAVALFLACWLRGESCDAVYGASGDAICTALPAGKTAATCTVLGPKPPTARVA